MTKSSNIMDRVKTFEDAAQITGRPVDIDFSVFPEDMREYFAAHYKLAVVTEAINEGWKANYSDAKQPKWYPWFYNAPGASSFAFSDTDCTRSYAYAGYASRLCFKSEELARYAGEQFIDLWNILLKK